MRSFFVAEWSKKMAKWDMYGEEAERLFVEKGLTLEQISQILPVSRNTLSKWRRERGWDNKRAEFIQAPSSATDTLRKLLLGMTKKLEEKIERGEDVSPATVDSITKLVSSIRKLEREIDILSSVPVVLQELILYIRENDPGMAREFEKIARGFSEYIWEKFKR